MSNRRRQRGFSLLEAIVAMTILATAGMALFAAMGQSVQMVARAENARLADSAVRNAVAWMETVNPAQTPQGEQQLGDVTLRWSAELVEPERDAMTGYMQPGHYRVGLYDVRLSVTDDSGSSCRTRTDVVKVQVNAPPVAVADGDRQGFTGGAYDQMLFDASASSDADGEPLSYLWDLGDGVQLAGEKILHAYAEPGDYDVKLGVSDGSGLACGQAWTDLKVAVRRRE